MIWIKLYYFTISNLDKNFTTKSFCILKDEILKCTNFIAIHIYSLDINNLDIKLVI